MIIYRVIDYHGNTSNFFCTKKSAETHRLKTNRSLRRYFRFRDFVPMLCSMENVEFHLSKRGVANLLNRLGE